MTRIYQFGSDIVCHDPGPEMIPFFSEVDPDYRLQSKPQRKGFVPRCQKLRKSKVYSDKALFEISEKEIKQLLKECDDLEVTGVSPYAYSKLDLMYVLALKCLVVQIWD